MLSYKKVDSTNKDFLFLVEKLDAYLAILDGKEHAFYAQYNKVEKYEHVLLVYDNKHVIACGAIVPFEDEKVEVKRMYTVSSYRGKGVATKLLKELEHWAVALGFKTCILETGKRMPDAMALYQKNGYLITTNYGQYVGIENSVCYKKDLTKF